MNIKRTLLLTTSFLVLFFPFIQEANSQSLVVQDTLVKIGGKDRQGFYIASEAEAKPLQKAWKKFLKKNYDIRTSATRNTLTAVAVKMNDVGDIQFDLSTFFIVTSEGSRMVVTAATGYDDYLSMSTKPVEFNKLKDISAKFVKDFLHTYYNRLIKDKEKMVKNSVKEEKSMIKEIKKFEKDLKKDKAKIVKLNKRIERNTISLENNQQRLPELKSAVEQKKIILKAIKEKQKKIK